MVNHPKEPVVKDFIQAAEGVSNEPELSHVIALSAISQQNEQLTITASEEQCIALAARFDLPKIYNLSAKVHIEEAPIFLRGQLQAEIDQLCAATGEILHNSINAPLAIKFITAPEDDSEVELDDEDCDVIFHDGNCIDIGEAIAQSLYLEIDPFIRADGADEILSQVGVISEETMQEKRRSESPFSALSSLKKLR